MNCYLSLITYLLTAKFGFEIIHSIGCSEIFVRMANAVQIMAIETQQSFILIIMQNTVNKIYSAIEEMPT